MKKFHWRLFWNSVLYSVLIWIVAAIIMYLSSSTRVIFVIPAFSISIVGLAVIMIVLKIRPGQFDPKQLKGKVKDPDKIKYEKMCNVVRPRTRIYVLEITHIDSVTVVTFIDGETENYFDVRQARLPEFQNNLHVETNYRVRADYQLEHCETHDFEPR